MSSQSARYVVSACLAGIPCRYDGGCSPFAPILRLVESGQALPVCPEQLGGLPTPRVPAEIRGRRVVNREGKDVTEAFAQGAREALRLARLHGCTQAVLKARSPSCGCGRIYDGTFGKRLIDGNGLFAQSLLDAGFTVCSEETFEEAQVKARLTGDA